MKKKIDLFWYWFVFLVAFVFCFCCINNKSAKAYHLNEEGNVVSDNLLNLCLSNGRNTLGINTVIDNNCYLDISGVSNTTYGDLTSPTSLNLSANTTYTFSISKSLPYYMYFRYSGASNNSVSVQISPGSTYQTFESSFDIVSYYFYIGGFASNTLIDIQDLGVSISSGNSTAFEPFGTWYSQKNAQDMYQGKLPSFTSSVTYNNTDNNVISTIDNVNEYIDNSYGYLYFNRLWTYLDELTGSSYDDAKLTIIFEDNLNINTSYIINSTKQNFGSGVWFYQNNDLMLDVRNFYDNEYCVGSSPYSCSVDLSQYVNLSGNNLSFSFLNKIVVWSSNTDERTLSFGYNNIGYNEGYNVGYKQGFGDGELIGNRSGYNDGYRIGYNLGYEKGNNSVSSNDNTLVGMVGAILTAPVNMLQTIFDFEFLGVNLTQFIFSLVSVFIIIWLIKKFI